MTHAPTPPPQDPCIAQGERTDERGCARLPEPDVDGDLAHLWAPIAALERLNRALALPGTSDRLPSMLVRLRDTLDRAIAEMPNAQDPGERDRVRVAREHFFNLTRVSNGGDAVQAMRRLTHTLDREKLLASLEELREWFVVQG